MNISIHAPLTGCDVAVLKMLSRYSKNFNPRTPYGMRQKSSVLKMPFVKFQSTHPLRDATLGRQQKTIFVNISIHAPLTGCDCLPRNSLPIEGLFQSTHPLRDATFCSMIGRIPFFLNFNPRTPYGMRQRDSV